MEKKVRDAMSLMSWKKNNSMYRVIFRDTLGKTKGDLFWDRVNKRFQKLEKALAQD